MGSELITLWLGVLSFLAVAVPAWFGYRQRAEDNLVSSSQHQSDNQLALINELQEEMESLRRARSEDSALIRKLTQDYRNLEHRLYEHEKGVELLLQQILHIGHEPAWQPEPWPGRE